MKRLHRGTGFQSCAFAAIFAMTAGTPGIHAQSDLADALKNLDVRVFPAKSDEAKDLQQQLGKWLRAQRDQINRRDVQAWDAIKSKEDWETYRDIRIAALKKSLGTFPDSGNKAPNFHIAKTIPGDGFVIENLVYESRPDLWVTANLYKPLTPNPSPQGGEGSKTQHPGILIIHSHHNPKTQGELQDMGMTWARAGCYVLVPDMLGHGERRQHPFVNKESYPTEYKVGRQDYFFRYNVAMHLHLVGESLVGWMANDMMCGVDLLYTKPGIDKKAIILLGSVAGGGDPAGVTAALDPRITCVVPFNFGGPQPETKLPLPDDARLSFNYLGGGSWESTRNLRLSGRDGFLPWLIVGSVAPRALIHAHEFAWDESRDPVWDRYRQIFKWYDAEDKLGFSKGAGSVTGSGPGNTHCNNIGVVHRKAIHPLFEKWFGIKATEYSKRVPSEELQCLTPEVKAKIKFMAVHELAGRKAAEAAAEARKRTRGKWTENQRQELAARWQRLFAGPDVTVRQVKLTLKATDLGDGATASSFVLPLENSTLQIPVLSLAPPAAKQTGQIVIAVAQQGRAGFLKERREQLQALIDGGAVVLIPELPGCGEASAPGEGRGRTSGATSHSATAQMLGATVLGLRLACLRAVIDFMARDKKLSISLWGDSFATANDEKTRIEVPYDVDKAPRLAEPTGPLLALLAGASSDTPIHAIYTRGGLVSVRSILDNKFIYVPHDCAIPGALLAGDLNDLAAAYLSRKASRLAIEVPVDGVNRAVGQEAIAKTYAQAAKMAKERLRFSTTASSPGDAAAWLRGAVSK